MNFPRGRSVAANPTRAVARQAVGPHPLGACRPSCPATCLFRVLATEESVLRAAIRAAVHAAADVGIARSRVALEHGSSALQDRPFPVTSKELVRAAVLVSLNGRTTPEAILSVVAKLRAILDSLEAEGVLPRD